MEILSCHDGISMVDLQSSVMSEVDHVKDKLAVSAVSNSLEMTAVGHNGILITDTQEIGSQKTEELTVQETDSVLCTISNLQSKI